MNGSGQIELRARREGDRLVVTVTDNGPGPAGGVEGVGLRNTNARLREMYGASHRVVLRHASPSNGANPAGGTEAEIALPYHTAPIVPPAP